MISGRQTLATIDQALNDAHSKVSNLESRISTLTEQRVAQQQSLTEDHRELAGVHLDNLLADPLRQHLDQAERQVLALFEQRQQALTRLEQQILAAVTKRQEIEEQRTVHAKYVDTAIKAVDETEAATQNRLEKDNAYLTQRNRVDIAERKAGHAAEKATRSEQEQKLKGEAYRSDALFMYLWQRHYGLPAYAGSGLFRWLDNKVARLVGYADARVNFARLNEIPQRLRDHAVRLQSEADIEYDALKLLDEKARESDGIKALEQQMSDAQEKLDHIDQRISENESRYQTLMSEQTNYATGDDEFTRKGIDYLATEFQREDLKELRYEAMETPYPDDDLIISRMLQREQELQELEDRVNDQRQSLQQQQKRLKELEGLRIDFKANRFDRAGSTFKDNSMVNMMLAQFLDGLLDRDMLWKVLREQQRYRPKKSNPTFGSGGYGRGSVWNGGIGDIVDILDGLGRSGLGGRSRGGGGGMGGGRSSGGFRTGGGF